MVLFFPNTELKAYSYSPTIVYDEDDVPTTGYEYRENIKVDLQPVSAEDSQREFGKILQDTYKIFLEPNTEINDTDILIDDEGNEYKVIGTPQNWNHLLNHKHVLLQKQRKRLIKDD